jgi:hypothetical protein
VKTFLKKFFIRICNLCNICDDDVLGFGTCRLISRPMFLRNVLSPSSGLKWQCWEVEGFILGKRKGRLMEWANQRQGMRGGEGPSQ